MSIGIDLALLFLASLVAVPPLLGAYSRLLKRRHRSGDTVRTASLERVRRAERLWFRVSPFILIAAAAIAILLALQAR